MANMASGNTIAEVASLIGDATRANMLAALMGGQALTAGELARHGGVTAQTTSGHLAKLVDARMLCVVQQGRHRYYRLASPELAEAIHALMAVAVAGPKRHHPIGPKDAALRLARTCYDHMAGRLALAIADGLERDGHVILSDGAGIVTDEGRHFLAEFGIGPEALHSKRPLCRTCLDWSERRPHIAGQLGAALLEAVLRQGWVVRSPQSRALRLTAAGERGFIQRFGLPPDWQHMAEG
jgi:DNA-binding transcriptional ArsR family regulator